MVRADNDKRCDDEPPAKQFTLESKEVSQYPLIGKIPYSIWIDGTAQLFTNNAEYAQSNLMKSNRDIRMRDANVLLYLAGLYDGELTEYEWAVAGKVREFLSSFDWQGASDYEKAERAIRFIAENSRYIESEGDGLFASSTYSCLVKGTSTCDGFAQSFHLLTKSVGIKSFYVSNLNHAWNYINTNEMYYEIDTSALVQIFHFVSDKFDDELDKELSIPSKRANEYIWTLNGTQFQFNPDLPSIPLF